MVEHPESRQTPAYALVVAKNGPKMARESMGNRWVTPPIFRLKQGPTL